MRARCFPVLGGSMTDSLSPMIADGGAMMEPACSSEFRSRWSISLTFKKINELGRCLPIETFLRLPHGRGQDALPAPTPAAAPPASPSAATSKEAHDEE